MLFAPPRFGFLQDYRDVLPVGRSELMMAEMMFRRSGQSNLDGSKAFVPFPFLSRKMAGELNIAYHQWSAYR